MYRYCKMVICTVGCNDEHNMYVVISNVYQWDECQRDWYISSIEIYRVL